MSCEGWAVIRLGDACTKIGSGATPRGGGDVYLTKGPYALIRSQNIYNDGFHRNGLAYIGEGHATELSNVEVRSGDVLLNITGDSVARCCQVENSVLPARVNQHVAIVRPDQQKLDPRFLRYFLVSPETQAKLLSWAGAGGTRNALTKGMIESFEIPAPRDVKEQAAIGAVLGTLDEKIAHNRRVNETLESIARTLFKSWFVDFDPVRAKSEGRDPGLPAILAALFPNELVKTALGPIPKGWDSTTWGTLANLEYGKGLSGYNTDNGAFPVYGTNGRIGTHTEPLCLHPGVIVGRKGAYRGIHYCASPFYVIDTAFYVEPKVPLQLRWAYYDLLRRDINSMDSGSAIPSTSREDFYAMQVIFPPVEVQRAYTRLLEPMWLKQEQNWKTSHALATLREALLPKLISGNIRLPDADRFLGGMLNG
jgi:type I restriction enzyme S subunit